MLDALMSVLTIMVISVVQHWEVTCKQFVLSMNNIVQMTPECPLPLEYPLQLEYPLTLEYPLPMEYLLTLARLITLSRLVTLSC